MVDRTRRLLEELKIAEARSGTADSWTEPGRRARREVRRLRAAWEVERVRRLVRSYRDDDTDEADAT